MIARFATCRVSPLYIIKLMAYLFLFVGLFSADYAYSASKQKYRLLVLDSQFGNPYDEIRRELLKTLAASGYRQGSNLEVALHSAGNDVATGKRILLTEINKGFDVVFVGGTVATIAAKQALYGSKQPVVFGAPTDPVGIGVIDAFNQPPKANFTGVSYPVPPMARFLFIRQLLPHARTFGLIYADMPQSHSYNSWVRKLVAEEPAFKNIKIIFRPIPLVTGEDGDLQMAKLATPIIKELDREVDLFLKPNDQMGTRRNFAKAVWEHSSKPLIGIVKNDVVKKWGATAVVYPSHQSLGQQAANMIAQLFKGVSIKEIVPQWPRKYGYAVDLGKTRKFAITVPVGILQLARENIVQ